MPPINPGGLDRALVNSLDELPELPAETRVPAKTPPNRLASSRDANPAATEALPGVDAASMSDRVAQSNATSPTGDSETISVQTPDADDSQADSDLETAIVQAIPSSSSPTATQRPSIRPASAAREDTDHAMVARAAIAPEAISTKSDLATLPENELYTALLTRLSHAPDDETEAERSRRLIMTRHLMVLAGDPDRAVAEIEDMGEEEQEYLRHQLLGLWTMIDPEGHPVPARRFTTALPQLREATKYLAAATDSLDVRSLAFCTEIEAYGQIKTFPGNRFDAGQQVILYCEIENFTVSNVDNGYETNLQGSYDIFNGENEKVLSQLLPADKQVSSNYLRDYFIAYQMHLPKQLERGPYRLQLTMEDVAGKKYGQASIPFEIK